MPWRITVTALAGITGAISWLYMSYSDKTSIEQDVESNQRASSTTEEVDDETSREQAQEPQTLIRYAFKGSFARSPLFPRNTFATADCHKYH